ncbi:4-diphosphocytidyl-2-C-methyl-D-erythritol kinase [Pseudooceanicola antarcticus]|uniref:4-diphosphocytidyl-2-C-methyl-D-erythritol kinase n=1 Tax=Pseudooceanicola antarcticus TaxID=1247613 RepID=A0A285ITR3_9RHOB|nr:4-(cytidine 5'-diphospho)-2-C-methyl-D-erythritol kinase [Pseudooceanicola antarcticus]PJE31825.1 4-(cytidine 5'-diphospho)-2-C-methyl-D-erythritol kinase [Pseudooceanicola antarcticus]SNY50486.1 4-diphosphocytidyl-2-C-methyl-D-erythritol kinase [Pseudooceanicola antarcticus]
MTDPEAKPLLAPAKVNLALHVTGRRDDGYHLLDSLVVFADIGDRVQVTPAGEWSLTVSGPRAAGVPTDESNLCLKAARFAGTPVAIHLEKHLPSEAGIGGGSSDAAAVLRGIAALGTPIPKGTEQLGADVPVCLTPRAARMQGVGEHVSPVTTLPPLPALLVNPGRPVATPAVFKQLETRDNPEMGPLPERLRDPEEAALYLSSLRNDLEGPAMALEPAIGAALSALGALPLCLLARMSGSGASCFALFPTQEAARTAGRMLSAAHPDWWVCDTVLS